MNCLVSICFSLEKVKVWEIDKKKNKSKIKNAVKEKKEMQFESIKKIKQKTKNSYKLKI